MRIVSVVNHKGGTGKTSTTVNLGGALAEAGRRVLLVDLDPQGSASTWLGAPAPEREAFDALVGTRDLDRLVLPTSIGGLDIVPASPWLVTAERMLLADLSVHVIRAFQRLPRRWDVVLVDSPPSFAYLAVGALAGSRYALVPVELHRIALPGVRSVLGDLARLRGEVNPSLELLGIVGTRANRTVHAKAVADELRADYDGAVFEARIRDSVRVAEAEAAGVPITAYASRSPVADDYRSLATEVLERLAGRPHVR